MLCDIGGWVSVRSVSKIGGVLTAAVLLAGCAKGQQAGQPPVESTASSAPSAVSHGGPVRDHVSFVDALRARGVTVAIAGTVAQPFLRAKGTQLRLSGTGFTAPAVVESYNYDQADLGTDPARAVIDDTSQIGPDGSPKTLKITWVAPPHLYRAERLVVLYVGSDPAVQQMLTDLIGPQFAGK